MFTATTQTHFVQFSASAAVGVFVGLFVGGRLRSWLSWREWVDASREAESIERPLTYLATAPTGDSWLITRLESPSDGQTGPELPIEPSKSAAAKLPSPPRRFAGRVERTRRA